MSPLLAAAAEHPVAVGAGWTALVVLWGSVLVAVALTLSRALRPAAPAHVQHQLALGALSLCLVLTLATPVLLHAWPNPAIRQSATQAAAPVRVPALRPAPAIASPGRVAAFVPTPASANRIAGVAGFAWLTGSVLLLVRLAGGWWQVMRVRRRAVAVVDPAALETLRLVSAGVCEGASVVLLESHDVEAPMVVGARPPVLLVPDDLSHQLGAEALASLVAHECAHIRRSDYLVNIVQSAVDAVLFFSPAVLWISRIVRETREYCCDDIAVQWCGEDRGGYVRALTVVAALGSRNREQPALGAAGPRLITRVRRLLSEEVMRRPSLVRSVAASVGLVAIIVAGWPVLRVSASMAAASIGTSSTPEPEKWPLPMGWVPRQPGSAVVLGPIESDATYMVASATLKNVADVAVTSVEVVAFVGGRDRPALPFAARTVKVDVLIEPGASVTVPVHLLDRSQLAEMRDTVNEPHQVFVGLVSTRFSNGAGWTTTPNPAARTMDEALSLPPAEIARQLVGVPPRTGDGWFCYDENRNAFSPGAVVSVRNEPGRYVECRDGMWHDYELPTGTTPQAASAPRDGVTLDLADASLDEVLDSIAAATGFTIRRAPEVPNARGLTARFRRAKVEDVLDMVLAQQGLAYRFEGPGAIVIEPRSARAADAPQGTGTTVPPRALKQVRAEYPQALADEGVQGTVVVTITIGTDGSVRDAVVKTALSPELDEQALEAARQWQFTPGTKDGVPVEVQTELEFTFMVR